MSDGSWRCRRARHGGPPRVFLDLLLHGLHTQQSGDGTLSALDSMIRALSRPVRDTVGR